LLILADYGGSNGPRSRVWKHRLQIRLCNLLGLTVTVCHYPPGSSKWNPIEHLFSARSVETGLGGLWIVMKRYSIISKLKQNYTLRPQILAVQDTNGEISCQKTGVSGNESLQVADQEVIFA